MKREVLIGGLSFSLLLAVVVSIAVYVGSQVDKKDKTGSTYTYLAYLNAQKASLHLVDPNDPTSPVRISDGPVLDAYWFLTAVSSFDHRTKDYSDLHIHSVFWIEEADGDTANLNGGPVMKLLTDKAPGTPLPEQVSRVKDACYISWAGNDPINKRKFMVVRTAGGDKNCYTPDDGKVFVHSGMTRADTPVDMKNRNIIAPIEAVGITGFLVLDSGNIRRCDTNLKGCSPPLLGGIKKAKKLAVDPVGESIYLCADGRLYVFDGADLNHINVSCGSVRNTWYDDRAIYAVSSGKLLRLPYGGSSWETIYDEGNARFIEGLTRNYVIISTAKGLWAVKKDGVSQFIVDGRYTYGWATSSSFVYTRSDASGVKYACLWREEDSNPTCTPNAYWAGFSLVRDGAIDISGGFTVQIYRLLKVEEVSYDSEGRAIGGILYAVDPANISSRTRLGLVPSGLSILGFGIGDRMLLHGFDGKQSDVFYVDLGMPGGLRRITDTAEDSEFPVFHPSGPPRSMNLHSLTSIFH